VIRDGSGLKLPSSSNGYVANSLENVSKHTSKQFVHFRSSVSHVPASPIFSLQIDPPPNPDILAKNPIMMMFDLVRDCDIGIANYLELLILSNN